MKNINRRYFIKTAGVAVAACTFSQLSFCSVPSKKKLGVALVGLGYYSTDLLAPALQQTKYCELKGVVTGSPGKVPVWQEKYGIADKNVYNYQNMHRIADNDDIDVIYIVLPNSMHAEYAIKAADAGKHVWCEKPMALNVAECQGIIDACINNKVFLSVGYRMQHEPNTQRIIEWSKTRPYGDILTVAAEAGFRNRSTDHWKLRKEMGGGAMYDMGVYSLNAARYAVGKEPLAVITASHHTTRPEIYTEVDETTTFQLEFPGEVIANCKTSFGMGLNDLRVDCKEGWYGLSPFQSYSGIQGTTSDDILLNSYIPNQQARQMDDDALAIMNNDTALVPGEEGLRDIRVVEAIFRAAAEGKRVKID